MAAINPCLAEFVLGNNVLHFLTFLTTDMPRLVGIHYSHNERDDISNPRRHDCLLNRLFAQIKGNIKAPVTGEFPAQRASNAENDSICWRHHVHVRDKGPLFCIVDDVVAVSKAVTVVGIYLVLPECSGFSPGKFNATKDVYY